MGVHVLLEAFLGSYRSDRPDTIWPLAARIAIAIALVVVVWFYIKLRHFGMYGLYVGRAMPILFVSSLWISRMPSIFEGIRWQEQLRFSET